MIEKLRPHQLAPFESLRRILNQFGTGVDQSGTGTGKTFVGAAVAIASKLPTLVVCPKIAQSAWTRAAHYLGDSLSVIGYEMLRIGNSPFGKWKNYRPAAQFFKCSVCQCRVDLDNFTPCPHHPRGIHCLETKRQSPRYGDFSFHPGVRQIIFDEVHRCNGVNSLNADLLIAAKREGKRVLGLSATMAHSPIQFRALGYLLDLHNLNSDRIEAARVGHRITLPSFDRWAANLGCRKDPRFHGWKWFLGKDKQTEIMANLRAVIIPERGVRVTEDDIPDFPQRDIQAELYTLDDPHKIDGCYSRMAGALAYLNEKRAADKAPDHPLTEILRARQEVELLKVPVFTELASDYLEKGFSVCCFVNFRQTIDELSKLAPISFRVIDGSPESVRNRDKWVNEFQDNRIRYMLVNSDAGGICLSLQDLFGGFPRMGLVSPCFSAVTLRQVFGRFQREGGKSRCYYRMLFADGTVEVPIWRAVQPKLNNIDALTDGDLTPDNLKLINPL